MMKIAKVEATCHTLPITVPLLREPIPWRIVFVRVETDTGVTGYGLTGQIQRFATRELINLIAAVANGWRVEFHYLMWMAGNLLYHDPPQPDRGWVTLPERPGLGLEPKEEVLRETLDP